VLLVGVVPPSEGEHRVLAVQPVKQSVGILDEPLGDLHTALGRVRTANFMCARKVCVAKGMPDRRGGVGNGASADADLLGDVVAADAGVDGLDGQLSLVVADRGRHAIGWDRCRTFPDDGRPLTKPTFRCRCS
jgi:hypothetical protein